MKVLVLVACLVAAALADEVPREIKEKKTVVEALPDAFHFDESKGPFHFGELRSLKPLVAEKALGSQQFGASRVDVKEYQVAQPVVTAYSAAPLVGQFDKVVKTVETLPGTTVYAAPAEYHVHEYQQPGAVFVKSVQEQVPVTAFQQTYVSGQPAAAIYKTEKVEEKPLLLTGDIQKIEKIEKVEKIEGEKIEGQKIEGEKIEKVELPAATAYSGGYEHSALIQKQPALATLSGYRSIYAQPAVAYQQTTLTQQPTFQFGKKIVSQQAVPVISTYTSNFPAASAYKKESTIYSAAPAVATYTSNFPAASAYKESTIYSAAPAVATYTSNFPSAYKKESTIYSAAPAAATYTSRFPTSSAFKKESSVFSQTGYSAAPAVSSYKQVISSAAPAVSSYKQESVFGQAGYVAQPAVSSYSATVQPALSYKKEFVSAPAAFEKTSNIYSQSAYGLKSELSSPVLSTYKKEYVSNPVISTYTSTLPAASAYKKESTIYSAAPAVATYTSNFPAASAYKKESTIYSAAPAVATYTSTFPAASAYKKESTIYSAAPAVATYTSSLPAESAYKKEPTIYSAAPAAATYTSSFPAASAYKKESTIYSAAPAVATYTSSFPAASAYKESTIYSAAPAAATYTSSFPAASAYKKESTIYSAAPAVATYTSSFPASSAFKKESSVFSQTGYSAAPAVSSYKQVISSAAPAVSSYKQESVFGQAGYVAQPAVSSYSATVQPALSYKKEFVSAPAAFEKTSNIYSQSAYGLKSELSSPVLSTYKKEVVSAPAVSTYTSLPASASFQKESSVFGQASFVAQPTVSAYKQVVSSTPVLAGYKQESILKSSPAVSTYNAASLIDQSGSAFQKDALLYSQSAHKYGGSATFPASYQTSADGSASIVKLYKEGDGSDVYQYGYATSNGIVFDEEGKVYALNAKSSEQGKVDGASAVTGSYSYVGPDGVTYTVKYIADEHGFRAFGDHLPKLSEEAQRALDEAAKEADKYDEEGNLKHHY